MLSTRDGLLWHPGIAHAIDVFESWFFGNCLNYLIKSMVWFPDGAPVGSFLAENIFLSKIICLVVAE
jgi:hypothetical protein